MSVQIQTSFLKEVDWVNQQITKLRDWQSKNWAVGVSFQTGQPDDWARSFAQRGLSITVYVRGQKAIPNIGDPTAYEQNIATLRAYIEKERQEEVQWIRSTIQSIGEYKARSWAIGLSWPTGQPDVFSRSFAVRELSVAYYVRGNVSAGDPSAYDRNIATLEDYMARVGQATIA